MSDEAGWEGGTWEGARREQLRRSLELTVRERLEQLEDLADTSHRIAQAKRLEARTPDGRQVVRLEGCRPTPLASYLKALAVLRLVTEQGADPDARGWWEEDRFHLMSALGPHSLRDFFLQRYSPTPILAPWNGGSGFYPKDNTRAIAAVGEGTADRYAGLRATIAAMRQVLDEMALGEKPDARQKEVLLRRLRNELDDAALVWLDAVLLLSEDGARYPPLLGTGGNDGRLEFTNNYLQRLCDLLDPDTGRPTEAAGDLLEDALFGRAVPRLERGAIGQFAPGSAGGPNAGNGFEGASLVNTWDFVLMLEGALLFAATATRRMESHSGGYLSYPFTVRATGAGSGSTDLADEGSARGEMWMPLWGRPATLVEIRALLGEGRATVGRRNARDGLDFARSVAQLGVARGIEAFERYSFLMRFGRTYLATPLGRIRVRANPTARLIDQLERGDWLARFRALRTDAPARLASLVRRLDDALFALALHGRRSPRHVQDVLTVLGTVQRYLSVAPKHWERVRPVPPLHEDWITNAEDGTPEFRIAAALASLHARESESGRAVLTMLEHLSPVSTGQRRGWDDQLGHRVVWTEGSLEDNLIRVIGRRLLEAERMDLADRPFHAWRPTSGDALAAWLHGLVDTRRTRDLLQGLVLARIPARRSRERDIHEDALPVPAAYGMLKPFFATDAQLGRAGLLPEGRDGGDGHSPLSVAGSMTRALQGKQVSRAIALAQRRLRAVGLPTPTYVEPTYPHGRRLLASLILPIHDGDLRRIVRAAIPPHRAPNETGETE